MFGTTTSFSFIKTQHCSFVLDAQWKAGRLSSVWNLVLVILQHVVCLAPATEETALDDFDDECCRFFFTHLRIKTSFEKFYGLSSETWESSVQHEGH